MTTNVGAQLILEQLPWGLFGSFTTQERAVNDIRLKRMFFVLLRELCAGQRLNYKSIPFATRIESGQDAVHRHFHVLLGGIPDTSAHVRMWMIWRWKEIVRRRRPQRFKDLNLVDPVTGSVVGSKRVEIPYATADVRKYLAGSGAAGYISEAKNAYEVAAYNKEGSNVFLSEAAWRMVWQHIHRPESVTVNWQGSEGNTSGLIAAGRML